MTFGWTLSGQSPRLKLVWFLGWSLFAPALGHAGSWKMRAREQFETGRLGLGDGRGGLDFRGFHSVFDLFYEEPFRRMAGLTVYRGSLGRVGVRESVTITGLGLEGKLFPARRARLGFVRGGLLAQAVDPAGPPREGWNYGFLAGCGVELPIWKFGLAPEVGGKFLWGSRSRKVHTLYVALGVHFYVFPGDSMSRP